MTLSRLICMPFLKNFPTQIQLYLSYYSRSKTRFDIHSSFLHALYAYVSDTKKEYYAFATLYEERKKMRSCRDHYHGIPSRRHIRRLFLLGLYFQPKSILELGGSVGLTAATLALANKRSHIVSIDPREYLEHKAGALHTKLDVDRIVRHYGPVSDSVNRVLDRDQSWDMIYVNAAKLGSDLKSQGVPILSLCSPHTVLVVGNKHVSADAAAFWADLVQQPTPTLCVDMFELGLVFFNQALSKQYVSIIPWKFKPWRIGLF